MDFLDGIRVGTMKRLATFLANQENSELLSYIAVALESKYSAILATFLREHRMHFFFLFGYNKLLFIFYSGWYKVQEALTG